MRFCSCTRTRSQIIHCTVAESWRVSTIENGSCSFPLLLPLSHTLSTLVTTQLLPPFISDPSSRVHPLSILHSNVSMTFLELSNSFLIMYDAMPNTSLKEWSCRVYMPEKRRSKVTSTCNFLCLKTAQEDLDLTSWIVKIDLLEPCFEAVLTLTYTVLYTSISHSLF